MARTLVSIAGLVALVGCRGDSTHAAGDGSAGSDTGASSGVADDDGSGSESGDVQPPESVPTSSRHWRLSWQQYDRAMSELVGAEVQPSIELGFPRELEGFAGWLNQSVSLEAGGTIALSLEEAALAHAPVIAASLASCSADDAACVDGLVRDLTERAWRRPPTSDEVDRYTALFTDVADEIDVTAAKESVVEAVVRSPYFVFRSEVGDASRTIGADVKLTPHEIASSLSFGIWGAPPDDALLAAAADGSLDDPEQIEAHAQRLLADPRFIDAFHPFASQWLGFYDVAATTKDPAYAPEFDAATAAAMATETRDFLAELLADEQLTFTQMLTADYTFPPAELDWIYGVSTSGDRLDTPQRMGLLMQPSFLATHAGAAGTSPTKRGVFVVRRVACYEPPLPPDDLVAMNPEPDPDATTRELFERHSQDPGCAACHLYFDPLGMAFESFDAVGRYRTTENGLPVDPSGVIAAGVLGPEEIDVADTIALARSLADSPVAQKCFVRKAFQFFHGREDLLSDEAVIDDAEQAFIDSSFDIRELMLAFVRRPEFVLRRPAN